MKTEYATNDPCWIFCGEVDEDKMSPILSEGRVVFGFKLPDCPTTFYVIKIADPEWTVLEVRDAYLMSDAADKFPAYVKRENPQGYLIDEDEDHE